MPDVRDVIGSVGDDDDDDDGDDSSNLDRDLC